MYWTASERRRLLNSSIGPSLTRGCGSLQSIDAPYRRSLAAIEQRFVRALVIAIDRQAAQLRLCARLQRFEVVDQALDHGKAALPEGRVAGVEPEWFQELGVMLGAASRQHRKIAGRKTRLGALVDRVERVHQAIAERIGVDVERRGEEMREIGPEDLVAGR